MRHAKKANHVWIWWLAGLVVVVLTWKIWAALTLIALPELIPAAIVLFIYWLFRNHDGGGSSDDYDSGFDEGYVTGRDQGNWND